MRLINYPVHSYMTFVLSTVSLLSQIFPSHRRTAKKKKAPLAENGEWQQSPPDPHEDQRSPMELAQLQMAKSMASIPDIKEEEELLGR